MVEKTEEVVMRFFERDAEGQKLNTNENEENPDPREEQNQVLHENDESEVEEPRKDQWDRDAIQPPLRYQALVATTAVSAQGEF
ncbi:hypothetical protein GE061_009486 [Apolygus lucorum]|uniref:Uncharacterized protein n=1 Tax=Apolygus lucorum TaxID=248454 RepID=A0A8S9Y0N7_APOLU|nr:hypothetical protein GE061_009486 [Apolygus lucorum]